MTEVLRLMRQHFLSGPSRRKKVEQQPAERLSTVTDLRDLTGLALKFNGRTATQSNSRMAIRAAPDEEYSRLAIIGCWPGGFIPSNKAA